MKREEVEEEEEQPVTPAGRFFLQPEMDQVINCVIGMKNTIDIESVKSEIRNSLFIQHPRFRCVLVRDKHGREHWKRSEVDLEKHFIIKDDIDDFYGDSNIDDEEIVNNYVADLTVSSPLDTNKPLWEIHLLRAHKSFIFRIHHALGDGISLMSLFLSCCRKIDHPDQPAIIPSFSSSSSTTRSSSVFEKMWKLVMVAFFTLVYVSKFMLRSLWVRDRRTLISGGAGVELWPRKLATAKFMLQDMKSVKNAVPNATINDVLFGVISSGLARYLDTRSTKKPTEGLQITGLAMVNIREQPGLQDLSNLMKNKSVSRWGNQFGFILLPIYHYKDVDDPLWYVKRAKAMLDRKKLSLEPHLSYRIGKLVMTLLGPKAATFLNYRVVCNTSYTISNIVGPQEQIMFGGNPITYVRVTSSSLPHAITMHMLSYAGKAEMQILVAKDIIPDPHILAKCFQDALLEMKDAATATTATKIQ